MTKTILAVGVPTPVVAAMVRRLHDDEVTDSRLSSGRRVALKVATFWDDRAAGIFEDAIAETNTHQEGDAIPVGAPDDMLKGLALPAQTMSIIARGFHGDASGVRQAFRDAAELVRNGFDLFLV